MLDCLRGFLRAERIVRGDAIPTCNLDDLTSILLNKVLANMISDNSILRRLPAQLHVEQTIFLDGMRHAAEIADLAYNRLIKALTEIALQDSHNPRTCRMTEVYLDAWAFVDAVDRFFCLTKAMPKLEDLCNNPTTKQFLEIAAQNRKLRNVADHIARRIPHLIKHNSPALGVLTWHTFDEVTKETRLGIMFPGTARRDLTMKPVSAHPKQQGTSQINLEVGEHRVCLSDMVSAFQAHVKILEDSLEGAITNAGLDGKQAGADITIVLCMAP